MNAPIRMLALVPYPYDTAPGQRYRIEQWERLLRAEGVETTFEPFADEELGTLLRLPGQAPAKANAIARATLARIAAVRRVPAYDVVYLYREAALVGPALLERWIRRMGIPFVLDFDDAVFLRKTSPVNGPWSLLKFPSKTGTICRLASHVVVGNGYLAAYARRFNPHVMVIPSSIDTDQYVRRGPRAADAADPVIVWTGSYSTLPYLDGLRGVFRRLAAHRRFRLKVIGVEDYRLDGVDVEVAPWRSETEVADLSGADIGVMPLPDDPWTRGKCAMKALQYMGLGIAAVCSPVGANAEIVQHGRNGLLATSEDEWVDALARLLDDPQERARLGEAGRATVEAGFSAAVQAPRFHDVVRSVLRARTPVAVE